MRFNVSDVHPHARDFHLQRFSAPSDVQAGAVWRHPPDVPRAVQAWARHVWRQQLRHRRRRWEKVPGGQRSVAQVPNRDASASYIQLAQHAGGARRAPSIGAVAVTVAVAGKDNPKLVVQRAAVRHRQRRVRRRQRLHDGPHRRLSSASETIQPVRRRREGGRDAGRQGRRDAVPAEQHCPQRDVCRCSGVRVHVVYQHGHESGDGVPQRRAPGRVGQDGGPRRRVSTGALRRHHHCSAGTKGAKHVVNGQVKRERRHGKHGVVAAEGNGMGGGGGGRK